MRAAGQPLEHLPRFCLGCGLSENLAVHVDLGVAGQQRIAFNGSRLAPGVFDNDLARVAVRQLLDVGWADVEGNPQLLEDRAPLRRGRGEYQPRSGKNSAASRAADSFESEPWTMFCVVSRPKSPRIEPGAASSGLVAPITWRAATTAS